MCAWGIGHGEVVVVIGADDEVRREVEKDLGRPAPSRRLPRLLLRKVALQDSESVRK